MSTEFDSHVTARRTRPWGLLALNAALVLALGVVTFAPEAIGQFQPRGETLAISSRTGLGSEQVLWLFDTQAMKLVAVGWNRSGTAMTTLDQRDVSNDVKTLQQAR